MWGRFQDRECSDTSTESKFSRLSTVLTPRAAASTRPPPSMACLGILSALLPLQPAINGSNRWLHGRLGQTKAVNLKLQVATAHGPSLHPLGCAALAYKQQFCE